MSLLSIDIARLIHHHLLKEGYENSANDLISECPHLKGLKPVKQPYKLPRLLLGPSLAHILENYFESKDYVIEELDSLENAAFQDHDSLLSLSKTLVENLKSHTAKETCVLRVNTESRISGKEDNLLQNVNVPRVTCGASVNTQFTFGRQANVFPQTENTHVAKETCDVHVNMEPILSIHKNNSTENTQAQKETCDTHIGTDFMKESSPSNSENRESAKNERFDFSLVYDRLLEDQEFQEKIAENINKKKAEVILYDKESSRSGNLASAVDLNAVIKAIVAETQADPAFDNLLEGCFDIDIEDSNPVGTSVCTDEIEPTSSPTENQENLPLLGEHVTPLTSGPSTFYCTIQHNDLLINPTAFDSNLNKVTIEMPSGQVTLVPATVSTLPPEILNPPKKRGRGKVSERPIIKRPPIAIAPKPTFTITISDPASDCNQVTVNSTVSEAVTNLAEDNRLENQNNLNQQKSFEKPNS